MEVTPCAARSQEELVKEGALASLLRALGLDSGSHVPASGLVQIGPLSSELG